MNEIPFLDLVTPHQELKDELCEVFLTALKTAGFIGGAAVEGLEREFAAFCGAEHCVGLASGTDAVRFALMAAGVRKDSIVVTVPNTFIATTEGISQAGGHPVFVDIDERTYNMDPAKLREYLEERCYVDPASGNVIDRQSGRFVDAIVPVHLYGQIADMDAILELAARFNLIVVEDACQAHGAEYFSKRDDCWKKAGTMGVAAAFSFYPGKNLGACGEGGAATTNDPEIARKMRMLRDHGQSRKYYHDIEGYNGRLDAIQAGILRVKLRHLAAWNEQRRACAKQYGELLGDVQDMVLPFEPVWSKAVYHLYVVRVDDRKEFQQYMAGEKIGTAIHYPVPLHQQKAYENLGYRTGDFPVAERYAASIVSLPMFPGLKAEDQERIAEAIKAYASRAAVRQFAAAAGD